MPVPKRKTIRANRNSRRAHIKMEEPSLVPLKGEEGVQVPRKLLRSYKEGLIKIDKKS